MRRLTADHVGERFGRLVVLERAPNSEKGKASRWLCKCDCGETTVAPFCSLSSGNTRSCGCLAREASSARASARNAANGPSRYVGHSAEHSSWQAMRTRCLNHNSNDYPDYGGRGITICERWNDFAAFIADMGPRPPGTTLDRYPDNNGNYEPGNCRWATVIEQNNNRRPMTPIKLRREDYAEIANLADAGLRHLDIAARFGIGRSRVNQIIRAARISNGQPVRTRMPQRKAARS